MGYNLTENLFGYTLVQDILVESATTSVTFSGLNYTAADDLLLVSDLVANASSNNFWLYTNGNTTNTNYYRQNLYANSTTVGAGRNNESTIAFSSNVGDKFQLFVPIKLTNSGYFVYQSSDTRMYGSSGILNDYFNGTSTFTASSITSLTVSAQYSNGIGLGSRFRLYKLNATKVADITVGTATTSVDITGLNITKDSEYMLVSDVSFSIATPFTMFLFANNNTTWSNYYSQILFADSTTVSSGRTNYPYLFDTTSSSKSFNITNLKLTNNGNFIWQNSEIRKYGSSSCMSSNTNGTSTFTLSSINQISITAQLTNGILSGSRFQLYRMKG